GPVRSGRLTDSAIADDLNHPVFAYSGTNGVFLPILRSQPLTDVDGENRPDLFWRNGAAAPHNLYANVASLAGASTSHTAPHPLFAYVASGTVFTGPGIVPLNRLGINFPANAVTWDWNARLRAWTRNQDGTADVDSAGVQISAAN